ncbi:MAG: rhombosortase [Thiolinea sp.]
MPLIPRPILLFAVIFSLLLFILQGQQPQLLYQRESIPAGDAWRLLSASFVHTNYSHLLLNLAGFWLFLLLCSQVLNLKFLISSIIFSALGVGTGLFLLSPQIIWYAGFSGVQYGLFLAGAIYLITSGEKTFGVILLALISAKIILDAFTTSDQLSQALIDAPVIQQAHWYGAVSGIICTIPRLIRTFRTKSPQPPPNA